MKANTALCAIDGHKAGLGARSCIRVVSDSVSESYPSRIRVVSESYPSPAARKAGTCVCGRAGGGGRGQAGRTGWAAVCVCARARVRAYVCLHVFM